MDLFTLTAKLELDTTQYEQKIKAIIENAKKAGEEIDGYLGGGVSGTGKAGGGTGKAGGGTGKAGGGTGKAGGGTGKAGGGTGKENQPSVPEYAPFGTTVKSILAADFVQKGFSFAANAGKEAVEAASDLVEVQNVIEQTFGSSADQINRWAESQAGAYGLSELQAKQFAGYYGSMMQTAGIDNAAAAQMSMNLAELAGDIASFYNIGIEEAYQKIQSGLAGEREPLLRFGLDLGADALGEYYGTEMKDLTNAERFQLRYDYLMDKTRTVQGDYMRTADEVANSQRTFENNLERLKASFGEKLMPTLKAGYNAANDLFDSFYSKTAAESLEDIDSSVKNTSDNIELTAINARAMIGVLEDYGDKSALTADQQAQWDTVAGNLIRSIPQLGSLIDMQTGKIEGGTAALVQNVDAWEEAGKTAADTAALEEKRAMLSSISSEIANEQAQLSIAEKQLEQNQTDVISLGAKVAETLGKEFDGTVESTRKLLSSNAGWYAALQTGLTYADIVELMTPLNEAEAAITTHKENIAALQTEYSTVEQSIAEDSSTLSQTVESMEKDVTASFASVESATDSMVSNFNQSGTAYSNSYNTGISAANGLNDAYAAYKAAASQYTFGPHPSGITKPEILPFETGLDYVPYDDFYARLHEGEAVLTKDEATAWRRGDNVQVASGASAGEIAAAVASALDGAMVAMDKERVGELVLPTVSRGIAREAKGWRYAT